MDKDIKYIRYKIIRKTKAELMIRISKGYKDINLLLVEGFVDKILNKLLVSK